MNHLNSTLIEGFIATDPKYSEGEERCTFNIQSHRYNRIKGGIEKKVNHFSVVVPGKIGKECSTKKKGTGLRVIGRLDTAGDNAVIIEAESIMYRPELSGKGEKQWKL